MEAYIVEALRTAGGRRKGRLRARHPSDPDKLNVNGGGILLGHPLGASGRKLMATLVHALRARGKRYGLQTISSTVPTRANRIRG